MKRSITIFLVCIVSILVLTACFTENDKLLRDYAGTYIGDASNVGALVSDLLGGEFSDGLDLRGQVLGVNYIASHPYQSSDPEESWLNRETMEKRFLFNATYLTILVPNAVGYVFNVDEDYIFDVTREEMVEVLTFALNDFPSEEDLWDKEIVKAFLDENQALIIELVESDEFRGDFFDRFPIIEKR